MVDRINIVRMVVEVEWTWRKSDFTPEEWVAMTSNTLQEAMERDVIPWVDKMMGASYDMPKGPYIAMDIAEI